jgi:hypothetical protein
MEILMIVLEELNILLPLEREILAMFFLKEKKVIWLSDGKP